MRETAWTGDIRYLDVPPTATTVVLCGGICRACAAVLLDRAAARPRPADEAP